MKNYNFEIKLNFTQAEQAKTEEQAREEIKKSFYQDYGINLCDSEIINVDKLMENYKQLIESIEYNQIGIKYLNGGDVQIEDLKSDGKKIYYTATIYTIDTKKVYYNCYMYKHKLDEILKKQKLNKSKQIPGETPEKTNQKPRPKKQKTNIKQ